jgi:glycosyltransferase involved in cell wall biosynthesis
MTKTRVLLAGEFTGLSTGYGNYGRELLTRLRATGRYEVAEYSSYVHTGAPAARDVPWPVYGVEPRPGDERGEGRYRSNPANQFGQLDLERVLLDFRPTVCLGFRDPWADAHVADSPLRPFFRWVYQPPVDSLPQENAWLCLFASADAVLTYTDWAGEGLRKQSGGVVNPLGSATPIPDDLFVPTEDKRGAKAAFGLDPDGLVVGSAMRSQPRKLIPDLMEAFAKFLASFEPLAARTTLYLHTSHPDVAWDLPELLKEYGILSKCLFTYLCTQCDLAYPAFYSSARTVCPRCSGQAMFPSTRRGVSREQLRNIFQTWDLGVQFSVAEGLGMPAMEMAACGVPLAAVDYSAMAEVVRNVGGYPVRVQRMFRDHGTNALRALPSNEHLADIMAGFLSMPSPVRAKRGFETREAYLSSYSWDKTVAAWEGAIQSLPPPARAWGEPEKPLPGPEMPSEALGDSEWLERGITHGAGRPELVGGYLHARMARDLAWGCQHPANDPAGDMTVPRGEPRPYTRRHAVEELMVLRANAEHWERVRAQGVRS